jgi:hypothetical protein
MATRMQQRRGTAQQWTDADPILAAGEIGFETDTSQFKIGDGVNAWSDLSYFKNLEDLGGTLDDYIPLTQRASNNGVATLDGTGQIPVSQLGNLIDGAPAALNTLNEIATMLGDGSTLGATVVASLSSLSSGVSTVQTNLNTHEADTTNIHGIGDTTQLATLTSVSGSISSAVSTHTADTTDVHGIADTALLATKDYADTAVNTHSTDTTNVHGIDNTALLATKDYADTAVSTHNSDTTDVHGIADTALLSTKSYADTAASTAVSTHNSDTTDVHGIADTAALATKAYADTAEADAITAAGTAADTKISTAVAALTKSSVGLGNVDNTADASKPVSTAQATAIATAKSEAIADATAQVAAVIASAPGALDTLDELAAALGDDANFASTVTTSLGLKAPLNAPTFTGTVTVAAAGVAFTDGTQTKEGVPSRTPIIQKTASYTLSALTERDSMIEVASSSATTITIPANSAVAYPVGTSLDILQTSTGQVTIAADAGVTVNATPGLKLRTQWSSATLFKRAENVWVVYGDLMA